LLGSETRGVGGGVLEGEKSGGLRWAWAGRSIKSAIEEGGGLKKNNSRKKRAAGVPSTPVH